MLLGMRTSQGRGIALAALCAAALAAAPAAAAADGPRAGKSVIAGTPASISDWPWQAAITREGRLHCGGSVIAPTKILTAAHCVHRFKIGKLSVVTGRSRLADAGTGQVLPIASAAIHPDYVRTFRHDVAVITLAAPTSAPAIGLPTAEENALATAPGTLLRVAGFGARNPLGGKISTVLMQTTERVRTNRRCRKAFRSGFSGRTMVCALGKRLGRSAIHTTACSGDSGGPLVSDSAAGARAVGVVSFGGPVCGFSRSPTVYSRVSDALPFILGAL
jgi:secreted trypsin-like serine protease